MAYARGYGCWHTGRSSSGINMDNPQLKEYRLRSQKFVAVQWERKLSVELQKILEGQEFRFDKQGTLIITINNNESKCMFNDYIVRDEASNIRIIDPLSFKANYEAR